MERIICLLIGYACGLFQTAYIMGKIYHTDIRKQGSGNLGSTNVMRTLGKKAGALNLLCDCLKCVAAILIVRALFGDRYAEILPLLSLYAAAGCILGHNFPFYLNFKGGKGIATTAAAMMAFDWRIGLCCFIIFVTVTAVTKYVSLASILLSAGIVVEILIFHPGRWDLFAMCVLYAFFAIYRHRANIGRLLSGTESKIGQKVNVNK